MPKGICYNASRQERRKCSLWHAKSPGGRNSGAFLFRCGKVAYALGWLPPIYLRPAICRCSRQLHLPKQREKMTEVHSCGSPPFSTCLGAVASFIISQGQKCHKKPFPLVYYQSHKEKSVKGGHRPQRLPLILFFVGNHAGGENGCPSVPLLPPVLHCPFRRKKVKGGLRPFFICCTR